MANINKLKDKIKSTIYPNGKGAINASDHQAMLLDMADGMAETDTKLTELESETNTKLTELSAELNRGKRMGDVIIEGQGDTLIESRIYGLIPGQYYRFVLAEPLSIDTLTVGDTYDIFSLTARDANNVNLNIFSQIRKYQFALMPHEYVVKIPSGTEYLRISGRCDKGRQIRVFYELYSADLAKGIYISDSPIFNKYVEEIYAPNVNSQDVKKLTLFRIAVLDSGRYQNFMNIKSGDGKLLLYYDSAYDTKEEALAAWSGIQWFKGNAFLLKGNPTESLDFSVDNFTIYRDLSYAPNILSHKAISETEEKVAQLEESTEAKLTQLEESTDTKLTQLEESTDAALSELEESTAAELSKLSAETDARFSESAESTREQIRTLEDKAESKFASVDSEIDNLKRGEAYVMGETLTFRNYADATIIGNTLKL